MSETAEQNPADPTAEVRPDEMADGIPAGQEPAEGDTTASDTQRSETAETSDGAGEQADVAGATEDAVDEGAEDGVDEGAEDGEESQAGAARTRRSRRRASREELEKEGEIAADFLETLLDICDLDGDLDVDIDGDRAAVSIVDSDEGRVPRRLVGTDGVVLDALQELTRLAVYSATGERSRLMLDIAGHRAKRREDLVAVAKEAIESVRASGERVALDAMTAFERKIVHDEVLAAGLHSESEGVEPRRFVVVLPTA